MRPLQLRTGDFRSSAGSGFTWGLVIYVFNIFKLGLRESILGFKFRFEFGQRLGF